MKNPLKFFACLCFILFLTGCEDEAPLVKISKNERTWIPYTINQQIEFTNDQNETVTVQAQINTAEISRSGKTLSSAVRHEQVSLTLQTLAPHNNSIAFSLRPTQLLIGASIEDSGANAEAILENKINGYEIVVDKFGYYTFIPEIDLMGKKYKNVFYRLGHPGGSGFNYFREYYYGKGQGLIAFKLSNQDSWYYIK